jgi:uncharacterized membrane protein
MSPPRRDDGVGRRKGYQKGSEDLAMSVLDLEARLARLGQHERHALARMLGRERVVRDPNAAFDDQQTLGDRLADRIATFGGSWTFISLFGATLFVWIAFNVERPQGFDPYPFILLNLALSCLAAIQAPIILMSQNRMAAKDRLQASHDYEVNLKAELEIMQLHAKIDELQQREWGDLLEIQSRQLEALERIETALRSAIGAGAR